MPQSKSATTFAAPFDVTTSPHQHLTLAASLNANASPRGKPKCYYGLKQDAFAKLGMPNAEVMGSFVGVVEVVCGVLVLLGLLTRLAAIPLINNILVWGG